MPSITPPLNLHFSLASLCPLLYSNEYPLSLRCKWTDPKSQSTYRGFYTFLYWKTMAIQIAEESIYSDVKSSVRNGWSWWWKKSQENTPVLLQTFNHVKLIVFELHFPCLLPQCHMHKWKCTHTVLNHIHWHPNIFIFYCYSSCFRSVTLISVFL